MSNRNKKTRLGLDLGTNSLGWSLLELNEENEPCSIIKMGVRIFSDGRTPDVGTTLNAKRREKRSARRRRDRILQRKKYLMKTLISLGFMPENKEEREKLKLLDPYELRKRALDEKIKPYEMGRLLFHLNQRRGFKSNRKSSGGEDIGAMKKSIKEFLEKIQENGSRTIGEYLYDFHKKGEGVRARRRGGKKTDLYDFYPNRAAVENEFSTLWDAQKKINEEEALFSEKNKNKLFKIIFYQRPLKPQTVGKCEFYHDKDRALKASVSFQKFRLWQDINSLKIRNNFAYKWELLADKLRKDLFNEIISKKEMKINAIESFLSKKTNGNIICNYRSEGSKTKFEGDKTKAAFKNIKKPLTDDDKDKLVLKLNETRDERGVIVHLNDDEIKAWLREQGYSEEEQDYILDDFENKLPSGHSNLSLEAIKKLLPHLENGLRYDEACEREFGSHSKVDNTFIKKLPLYNQFEPLAKYCIPRKNNNDKRISNPTVHVAMSQLRLVVNDIISHFGTPAEIVVELARDLPLGEKTKKELLKKQKSNRKRNEQIDRELEKLGLERNRENRHRYKLWEELAESPHDRKCPYSGEQISLSQLFTEKIEVDHILPYSITLDDSLSNKVVCIREENRNNKQNKSPYEAYGHNIEKYKEILDRVKRFTNSRKADRFDKDALEKFQEQGGFLERQLNNVRYISRIAKIYLNSLLEAPSSCWVVTGQLTAGLRYHWGCNKFKNRKDHRHHAVDATIIGLTSRSMLQKISHLAKAKEREKSKESIFKKFSVPWKGFREELKKFFDNIIVSHKPKPYYEGQIHEDTAYGIKSGPNKKGEYVVERRIDPIEIQKQTRASHILNENFSIEIKEIIKKEGTEERREAIERFKNRNNVKKIRIKEEKLIFIPKNNKSTGFVGGNNWAFDIFEKQDGTWGKYIISTFEAYTYMSKKPKNRNKNRWLQGYEPWIHENPGAKLIMRLHKSDFFSFQEDGIKIYKLQKISKASKRISYANHFDSETDDKNLNHLADIKKIQEKNIQKIHVSPAGFYRAVENN